MSLSKIHSLSSLSRLRKQLRKRRKKTVFTNGCFDVLHFGHVSYLSKARRLGDFLIIGLNSDASVRRLKGKGRPIFHQADRARMLAALECVDAVVIFSQDTPLQLLKTLRPDVLVKGADWPLRKIVGYDIVTSYGGQVKRIRFEAGRSTTGTLKRLGM